MQQLLRVCVGTVLLLGHDSVAVAVCWRGRDGFNAIVSIAERLWLGLPALALTTVFALSAFRDVFRPRDGGEFGLAAAAVACIASWAGFVFLPAPVWQSFDGYDRLAAQLSTTGFAGLPLSAFLYTLLFGGITLYVLRPTAPSPTTPTWLPILPSHALHWCQAAVFLAGFAGVLHFATGTFGR